MKTFPNIVTPRCRLSRITDADIVCLQEIFDDGLTRKFLVELYELINQEDGVLKFISVFEHYRKIDEGILWGIRLERVLIGFIGVMDLSENPTVFYAMHPSYRSQGYMKEGLEYVISFLSAADICTYMYSNVHNDNYSSIGLLESLDFERFELSEQKVGFAKKIKKESLIIDL